VEAGRVLAVQGRILPSTLEDVTLVADLRDQVGSEAQGANQTFLQGESAITRAGQAIERVFLRPDSVRAYPEAVRAILEADLIVAGPGSLYTSILPNLLVSDIRRAVEASRATKLYVCNVATQAGETDGYDVGRHVAALQRHAGPKLFPNVLANDGPESAAVPLVHKVAVRYPGNAGYQVTTAPMADPAAPWRHDSRQLARQVIDLYYHHRGMDNR
jgi:uncharacterized cofD-like protein